MACISVCASRHTACSSRHITRKFHVQARRSQSLGTKPVSQKAISTAEQREQPGLRLDGSREVENVSGEGRGTESSAHRFSDKRWKNGTWDLNMFAKDGKMDWDGVIVAEAKRRKFLELYPEASTNEEPVLFRSSIIPWWAWLTRSYLPEAELLNGRAAMVGFFTSYAVDALTGLDVVGQTGNFLCKTALFLAIVGIVLFRRTEDLDKLRKLAEEATHDDKQWRASWQDPNKADNDAVEKV